MVVLIFGLFSFENGSTKNGISTFQADLDFGGVRGEEEYYSKLPVRSL